MIAKTKKTHHLGTPNVPSTSGQDDGTDAIKNNHKGKENKYEKIEGKKGKEGQQVTQRYRGEWNAPLSPMELPLYPK